jgi:hypothetical protein
MPLLFPSPGFTDTELISLYFSHAFTTSLGVGDANVPTTVQSQDGNDQKKFEKDEVIGITIGDLFRMAGIQPDDRNPNSGGQAPKGNMDWPLWRMTGVSFMMGKCLEVIRTGAHT